MSCGRFDGPKGFAFRWCVNEGQVPVCATVTECGFGSVTP